MSSIDSRTYRAAQWIYESGPNQLAKRIADIGGNTPRAKAIADFCKKQVNSDFCDFAKAEAGGWFKTLIAEPPRFPLLLLLYPFTVGPRLYRAWERGRAENDYREMGDVLRRDLTAITFFVFALAPIVKGLSGFVQDKSKVNLLEQSGQVLKYSQFRNYELDTVPALKAILAEGSGPGLKSAIERLSPKGLDKKSHLGKQLEELKISISSLVDAHEKEFKRLEAQQQSLKAGSKEALSHTEICKKALDSIPNLDDMSEKVIKQIEKANDLREQFIKKAQESGSKERLKVAKSIQESFTGTLTKYAKTRRLPTDVVSFLAVVGLIGWLPVWFNSVWNKRQFDKENAAATQKPGLQNSFPPIQPMAPYSFSSHARYSQQNYALPTYHANNNPFNRPY